MKIEAVIRAAQRTKDPAKVLEAAINESLEIEYKYLCRDSNQMFETYGETATYSPFTGSMNIELVETEEDDDESFDFEPEYEPDYDYDDEDGSY